MTDPHDELEMNVVAEPLEQHPEPGQAPTQDKTSPLLDAARKVLLASIGAVALATDEIEDFVSKLVERGEIAEKDGRSLIKDVLERRRKMGPLEEKLDQQVERVVSRLNIPTKSDVDALTDRIADLSRKIDELSQQ